MAGILRDLPTLVYFKYSTVPIPEYGTTTIEHPIKIQSIVYLQISKSLKGKKLILTTNTETSI